MQRCRQRHHVGARDGIPFAPSASDSVQAGGRTRVDAVRRGGGFLSASDAALHFGLGAAETISSLVVYWPDGTTGRYHDLPVDALLTLRQGDDRATATPFSPANPVKGRHP